MLGGNAPPGTQDTEGRRMSAGQIDPLLRQLRRAVGEPGPGELPDAVLLGRWVAQRDEAAFELLVRRHGPLVLGVCRRLLADTHDVEDAFQATFLALVRKAGSIGRREAVGSWLYKVAYRVALRARTGAARRATSDLGLADVASREGALNGAFDDLLPVVDEELNRLPDRYRAPFVLCCLQGKTTEQAAREMGCPPGTLSSRLTRARQRLQARLTRRGVTVGAAVLAAQITEGAAVAAVPEHLVAAAAQAAALPGVGVAVSGKVIALAEGVVRMSLIQKLTLAAALAVVVAVAGTGVTALTFAQAPDQPVGQAQGDSTARQAANQARPANMVDVPSRVDGIVLFLGTEVRKGEKAAERDAVKWVGAPAGQALRRLRVGDRVTEGQLLAVIDDRLARLEVSRAERKLEAAKANYAAARVTNKEAQGRIARLEELKKHVGRIVSDDEIAAAYLVRDRYFQEEVSKKEEVTLAQADLQKAQLLLEMHQVRSPVRGTVVSIFKHRGEAVRQYEPVLRIWIADEAE
jgi:RNA polymerase sigma factor (sigma-70 family)